LHALIGPVAISFELLLVVCALKMSLTGRQFLRETPALESDEDLDRYRHVVSRLMYGALVLGALLPVTVIVVSFSCVTGEVSGAIGLCAAIAFFFKFFELITVEKRLQQIATAGEEARLVRDYIVAVWKGKVLPNW
jgi:hypothetical protein